MESYCNLAEELASNSLPESITTRDGYVFNPRSDFWIIPDKSGRLYFNFDDIISKISNEFIFSFKSTLIWYLKNKSACHSRNMYERYKRFINYSVNNSTERFISTVEIHHIISYASSLSTEHEWYIGSMRGFIVKWRELGYPGVTKKAAEILEKMTIQGNKKGWAVLTLCPTYGPFTERELRSIHYAFNNSFSQGRISNRQYSLGWLFMALGPRPSQIADLKIGDFSVRTRPDKPTEYILLVPRGKQRNQLRRAEFKERHLIEPVGKVLEAWCEQVKSEYTTKAKGGLKYADLPMFPAWQRIDTAPGFMHHSDGMDVRLELVSILDSLKVISHRTNLHMKITPTRFRYTLGTRAAIEKVGPAVIAELLDHSDIQNVMVYVQNSDELMEELDAELSDDLGPLSQAFFGKVVLFENADLSKPSTIIRYPGLDLKNARTGRCERGGNCGGVIPVACYTCGNFEAFSNGPHQEVLNWLLSEKAEEIKHGGDDTVARGTDAQIEAVKIVIQKCQEINGGA